MTAGLLDTRAWAWSLASLLDGQDSTVAGFDPAICFAAGLINWTHRDPFDRLLAATATYYNLPFASADHVFDGILPRVS